MNLPDSPPPSFVFDQPEQPSIDSPQQNKNQKYQHSNHIYQMDTQATKENCSQPLNESAHNELQTSIVHVKPIHSDSQQQYKPEENFLYQSQHSENQEEEMKEDKKTEKIIPRKNNAKTFKQELSQENLYSPQSSLRKLIKLTSSQSSSINYEEEPPQKLLNENISQSQVLQEEYNSDLEQQYQIETKKQLKSSNLHDLILYPIPQTKMIRCLVMITNNKFFSLENTFDLYLVQQKKHLLRAVKKRFRIYSSFEIFGKTKKNNQIVASIGSNFTRTEYKLNKFEKQYRMIDKIEEKQSVQGFSSDIIRIQAAQIQEPSYIISEQEVCYLGYESNFFGISQRKVNMLKPKKHIPNLNTFSKLKTTYENCQYERVNKYTTRMAEKGTDGNLILDFKEKNITNSSRNMIIENQYGEAGIMFAKFSEDIYILNVMNPFNLLEGFFLALCNLDRKPFVS